MDEDYNENVNENGWNEEEEEEDIEEEDSEEENDVKEEEDSEEVEDESEEDEDEDLEQQNWPGTSRQLDLRLRDQRRASLRTMTTRSGGGVSAPSSSAAVAVVALPDGRRRTRSSVAVAEAAALPVEGGRGQEMGNPHFLRRHAIGQRRIQQLHRYSPADEDNEQVVLLTKFFLKSNTLFLPMKLIHFSL